MTRSVIFAGPSIERKKLESLTQADIAPPIRRGDLEAFRDREIFVLIDGEFGQSLSVSPKEILALLDRGKVVIGASSMGALRASELDGFGMIGVGWVYARFARAAVRRDDDVALAFSPLDFAAVTVPMVNVQYWVEALQSMGEIGAREKAVILRAARGIFFADRTESRLRSTLRRVVGQDRLEKLLAATEGEMPDIKAIDAELAIRLAEEIESSNVLPGNYSKVTTKEGTQHVREQTQPRLYGIGGSRSDGPGGAQQASQ